MIDSNRGRRVRVVVPAVPASSIKPVEGTFQYFSTDHEDYCEDGPGLFPCAVIELEDGQLESFYVNYVQFLENSKRGK